MSMRRMYVAGLLLMMTLTCSFLGMKAEAAPEKVTGLQQIGATTESVELEWNEQSDEDVDYQVEYSLDKKNWLIEESTGSAAWTELYELDAGSTYYVRVKSYVETYEDDSDDSIKTFHSSYSDTIECVTAPEAAPESIEKISSTSNSITLQWDKVTNANAYIIEYFPVNDEDYDDEDYDDEDYDDEDYDDEDYDDEDYDDEDYDDEEYDEEYDDEEYDDEEYDDEEYDDEEYDDEEYDDEEYDDEEYDDEEYDDEEYDDEEYDDEYYDDEDIISITVAKNEVVLKNLAKDTAYVVTVYAARKNSKGTFLAYESEITEEGFWVTPSKVTNVSVTKFLAKSGKLTVTCNKKTIAEGYEAEIWTAGQKNDKKIFSKKAAKNTITLQKAVLKKAKFFKVRMRIYVLDANDSKVYSDWSEWKYVSGQPKITKSKVTKKGIKITWKKVEGAARYSVYVSDKKKKGYKKAGTSKKNSFVIKKVNKKKLKKNKKYYFYVVAEKKVGKKFITGNTKQTPTYSNKKYK